MLRRSWVILVAGFLLTAVSAGAGEPSAFDRMLAPYEAIRQALLHDGTEGVVAAAAEIGSSLEALQRDFSEQNAGVPEGSSEDVRVLLPAIRSATRSLQAAAILEEARISFADLSEAMARYRQLVADPEPVVVFCSMAKKVWLQPDGEIGNPYYGQRMARCGRVVSE